jgi:PP-loop superfamily ATP-utilizing enzyme
VRHLGPRARVEVSPAETWRLDDPGVCAAIQAAVLAAGYREVLLDAEGYRRGRLNEDIPTISSGVSF